jgi:hydrogenase large subunit
MGALLGGKMPHPPAYMPGGVTTIPRPARIAQFKSLLAEVTAFINSVYMDDVATLTGTYHDYFDIGVGPRNLLSFGVFGSGPMADVEPVFRRGYIEDGSTEVQEVNTRAISEHVKYAWYDEASDNLKPASGATMPVYPKEGAYSWSKAPRYDGKPFEAGPLARMWINGEYSNGISVMDRHAARAQEAAKLVGFMSEWLDQIDSGTSVHADSATVPAQGIGEGLTEAPRGALGHWLRIADSRIANYQVITPSCWVLSPRDSAGQRGPLEESLVGTPVIDESEPVEVLRVIHSFDPCQACAVHVMRPGKSDPVASLRLC